jgi:hypothetical protein
MIKSTTLGLLLTSLAITHTYACPPSQIDPFKPSLKSTGVSAKAIPRPAVRLVKIERGSKKTVQTCSYVGSVTLEVSVPEASAHKLKNLGAYFRVVKGTQPKKIFPTTPLTGLSKNEITGIVKPNTALFRFHWHDGHPNQQKALDLRLEIFFVSHDLRIGPSAFVNVQAHKSKLKL